jgi:hypothetical protein
MYQKFGYQSIVVDTIFVKQIDDTMEFSDKPHHNKKQNLKI